MTELRVDGLNLRLGDQWLLREIDLCIGADQRVALLGPSGSGKTLLLRALMGLLPVGASLSGLLRWNGQQLDLSRQKRPLPGLGLVFQGAGQALHPLRRIGDLLSETAAAHGVADPRGLLAEVGLRPVERYWRRRPDQLSGGQRQRALIALTLAARPQLLLADEPTAALDSVARAEVLALLRRLCRERGLGLLLVAHDPALVRSVCDQALVIVDGRLVERGALKQIFAAPEQPWTRALVAADGRLAEQAAPAERGQAQCVSVEQMHLSIRTSLFTRRRQTLLEGINFAIGSGERVALMGASGSGKSTLGRCLVGLHRPTAGAIRWSGLSGPLGAAKRAALVQMVLQDSRAALNPMHRVATSLGEVSRVQRGKARAIPVDRACALAEVDPIWLQRRPGALSGGQCQRVALARALIVQPRLLILDESLSALDPPLRVELIEQLEKLSTDQGFALLLITHSFSEARRLCSRVLVLDEGRLVEQATTADLALQPQHPASQALVDAWRGAADHSIDQQRRVLSPGP